MNEYKQLRYSLQEAYEYGAKEHPQKQMKLLGYEVLDAVPQSAYGSWWFTVKEIIEPLPPYLNLITYNYEYWHNDCWKNCEYFEESHGSGQLCCYGGSDCIKKLSEEEIQERRKKQIEHDEFWKHHRIISVDFVSNDNV